MTADPGPPACPYQLSSELGLPLLRLVPEDHLLSPQSYRLIRLQLESVNQVKNQMAYN